ncbi:hypothetical protein ACFS4T_16610 [Pseudomonas lini]
MTEQTRIVREVKLLGYNSGKLKAEHFAVVETAGAEPGPGQVLVRNRWFRVSISTRLMAEAGTEDVKGIPFPPLNPGDTLADGAIGEVVRAGPGAGLSVGSVVMHPLGWRDYAVVPAEQCRLIDSPVVDPAAWLGHGWTAYAALVKAIQVRPGDTAFVTSGAGAIGSMAGQIARLLGGQRESSAPPVTRRKLGGCRLNWVMTQWSRATVVRSVNNSPRLRQMAST